MPFLSINNMSLTKLNRQLIITSSCMVNSINQAPSITPALMPCCFWASAHLHLGPEVCLVDVVQLCNLVYMYVAKEMQRCECHWWSI